MNEAQENIHCPIGKIDFLFIPYWFGSPCWSSLSIFRHTASRLVDTSSCHIHIFETFCIVIPDIRKSFLGRRSSSALRRLLAGEMHGSVNSFPRNSPRSLDIPQNSTNEIGGRTWNHPAVIQKYWKIWNTYGDTCRYILSVLWERHDRSYWFTRLDIAIEVDYYMTTWVPGVPTRQTTKLSVCRFLLPYLDSACQVLFFFFFSFLDLAAVVGHAACVLLVNF